MTWANGLKQVVASMLTLAYMVVSTGAQAVDNDCQRPFTLDEAVAIAQSFQGPVDLPQCKSELGGRVVDTTEVAGAEIMGMLGIYTVACGRPDGARSVTEMIQNIVRDAVADGGNPQQTSLREVIAVRVYECVEKDK